jgi:hypothetical protein
VHPADDSNRTALELLDSLLSGRIVLREFFRRADELSDGELELPYKLIVERKAKIKNPHD